MLRKRCTVMCILEDQVMGAGWLKNHQPPGELYRNTPAVYGASIHSAILPAYPKARRAKRDCNVGQGTPPLSFMYYFFVTFNMGIRENF